MTRAGLVRDLVYLCKHENIEEVCILRNENNKEFIAGFIDEVKKYDDWTTYMCIK